MRFYVEFKRPELGDDQLWEYADGQLITWTDDYKSLLQVNREYRTWLENAPAEKVKQGEVPDSIIASLQSLTKIHAWLENLDDCHFNASTEGDTLDDDMDVFLLQQMRERSNLKTGGYLDLYPGLEPKTYTSSEVSVATVYFDTALDLDRIAENKEGITRDDVLKLLPTVKWLSGYLDLPLTMTPEQLEVEDNNVHTPWWYIARDTYFYIAGIEMAVFMDGSKSFTRVKE